MIEKQSSTNLTQGFGKENRPPKSSCKNHEDKRSSVPRTEKSKLLNKKSTLSSKRTQARKFNKSKKNIRSNGVQDTNSNSSILGYSQNRTRLNAKKLATKNYSTVVDEEKVMKEIDALSYLVINPNIFLSESNPKCLQGEDSRVLLKLGEEQIDGNNNYDEEIQTSRFHGNDIQTELIPEEKPKRAQFKSGQADDLK